eukprot:scaffold13609_cov106-Isochrysis_galbana.AAC.5
MAGALLPDHPIIRKCAVSHEEDTPPDPRSMAWTSGSVGPKPGSLGPIRPKGYPLGKTKMYTGGPVVPSPPPSSPRPNPGDLRRPSQNLAPRAPRPVSEV